jgi:hypothetical protein
LFSTNALCTGNFIFPYLITLIVPGEVYKSRSSLQAHFYLFMPFWKGKFCRKIIINFPRPVQIWLARLFTQFHPLVINDNKILLATEISSSCIIKWMGLRLLITRKL